MGAEDRRAGGGDGGEESLPQTSPWLLNKSFHSEERALDMERLHKAESGAWLGKA